MHIGSSQRMQLVLLAAFCIFVTWLICSTLGPPVQTDRPYRLLREPYGSSR